MEIRRTILALILAASAVPALGQATAPAQTQPALPFEALPDAYIYRFNDRGILKVQVVAENIMHVQYAKDAEFFKRPSFAVVPQPPIPAATVHWGGFTDSTVLGGSYLGTNSVQAMIHQDSGNRYQVRFLKGPVPGGREVLNEVPYQEMLEPAEIQGEKTFHVRQQWTVGPDESFYGLGQHQFGLVNLRDYDIELWQHNTEVAVPLLISSKGYGIFWDNPSFTKFGDPRDFAAIPPTRMLDAQGEPGGFTRTGFSDSAMTQQTGQRVDAAILNGGAAPSPAGRGRGANPEQAVRWDGQIEVDAAGLYQFQLYANGGYKMWLDDQLVADHWRQNWLPWSDLAHAQFEANSKHKIKVEWIKDGGTYCTLTWKPQLRPSSSQPTKTISLWSQAGDGVDYYFIYGGEGPGAIDRVIAGYRQLTGQAPMMPQWAFGLWQSRQRYETQQASLDVVRGFRDRNIPFDNIVQDWMYWRQDDWGSHKFDAARFPGPDQWVKDIHALNAHVMISVWGKFYPSTDNFQALQAKGFLYPVNPAERDWVGRGFNYAFYDAFNPAAREMFWQQVNDCLFSKHFDAWWMDATEPDLTQPSPPVLERQIADMGKTAAGPAAKVLNAYPLLNSQAVYEGQRKAAPDQRVFILTRSGYAGQQRYAAATWSGDISSSWTAMKKQIAAGLGYSISGLPYWTMDAGGFSVPAKFNARNPSPEVLDEWRELNARWFEFAAFVPLLRVHGEAPFREMWQFGGEDSEAYKAMLKADRLRYRLFPYIYSLAGDVTQNSGTFMRPLVMDFPTDKIARDLNDQYMFGPAFMVSPITTHEAREREVYLPLSSLWYNFWTGKVMPRILKEGFLNYYGRWENAPAPYDQIPLHIRAGSIIPLGPELQYAAEKKADPLTLWVYTGADGHFSLYEDDGLTYQYEKGKFARIPITWNDAAKTLTIGQRQGSFDGMLQERTIQVVFITPEHPVPFCFDPPIDKSIRYSGDTVVLRP